ncbi:hypothetical protein AALO_G00227520 [Alosa alosa]|uniref:Uncharacterized protein n=2 Tax=Alosa alosa TaxID=278164 RepID=A0AAV6G351_9TELE|nr:uncharacterized protein LOC125310477 isoform X1 [Alosa alosa]KAG5267927.1 hypothetical protein AALO_G00227520 [Alosa alosa]
MESNTSSDQEVTRAIILSLRDGISSFNSLCDSILNMDLTSPDTFDYEHIRVLIVNTEQAMRKTTQEAEGKLGKLDEDTENLTAQLHALAKVRDDNILNLDHLKTKLDAETQSLKNSEETLEQARTLLQNNEDVLNKQRSRKSTATAIAGASPAMLIVPVIGWIAAIAMAAGGGVEISEAEKAVHVAKEEVEKAECQVKTFSDKVSDYQSKISKSECDIRQTDGELERVRGRISGVQQQRVALAEFQVQMRDTVHLLGCLNGAANALELQTKRSILLEPVMKVIGEMVKVAGGILGKEILEDADLTNLINAMREKSRRLADICASHDSSVLSPY